MLISRQILLSTGTVKIFLSKFEIPPDVPNLVHQTCRHDRLRAKRKWRNGKQIQRWMVGNDGIFQGSPRFVFVPFQLEANRRATLKVPTNHPASQRTCFHLLRKLKGNLTPRTESIWDTEILIAAKELRSIIVYFLPLRVRWTKSRFRAPPKGWKVDAFFKQRGKLVQRNDRNLVQRHNFISAAVNI